MSFLNRKKAKSKAPVTDSEWAEHLEQLDDEQAEAAAGMFEDMNDTLGDTVKTLEQTKEIGTKTLEELEAQGEQLKGVDKDINDIRKANYKNERTIRGLTIWGKIKNLFLRGSCLKPKDDEWTDTSKSRKRKFKSSGSRPKTTHETDTTGSTPLYELYKENERGLDQVGDLTQDLEDIAIKMGETIDNQNENLDRILANADKAIEEMISNTNRANRALT